MFQSAVLCRGDNSLPRTVCQLFQSLAVHKSRPPGHQSQAFKGQSLGGLSTLTSFIQHGWSKSRALPSPVVSVGTEGSPGLWQARQLQKSCRSMWGQAKTSLQCLQGSVGAERVPVSASTSKFESHLFSEKAGVDPCTSARHLKY